MFPARSPIACGLPKVFVVLPVHLHSGLCSPAARLPRVIPHPPSALLMVETTSKERGCLSEPRVGVWEVRALCVPESESV